MHGVDERRELRRPPVFDALPVPLDTKRFGYGAHREMGSNDARPSTLFTA
jgi:hypothetical protein